MAEMNMRAYLAMVREEHQREEEARKNRIYGAISAVMALVLCGAFAAGIMGII